MSPTTSFTRRPSLNRSVSSFLRQTRERVAALDSISESVELDREPILSPDLDVSESGILPSMFRVPSEIFEVFILTLGPSMKSFAYTLSEILRQPPFASAAQGFEIIVNENFKTSLAEALALYEQARASALQDLYDNIELEKSRSEDVQADIEEVAAACSHFSYSLQTVAHEITAYLDAIDDFKFIVDSNFRSWEWLQFWRYLWKSGKSRAVATEDVEADNLLPPAQRRVRRIRKSAVPQGIPDEMLMRRDNYNWDAAQNTSELARKVAKKFMGLLRWLTKDDSMCS
jgi:hypothetical protein